MMDRPRDNVEEAAESVNPREQGLLASDPFELVRSDNDILTVIFLPSQLKLCIRFHMIWLGF